MKGECGRRDDLGCGPFFVYGTLKPGQPGYPLIKDYVERSEAFSVPGWCLRTHDGLPFMMPSEGNSQEFVPGFLLYPKLDGDNKLGEIISKFENPDLYRKAPVRVRVGDRFLDVTAYVAQGGLNRSDFEKIGTSGWTVSNDNIFAGALPALYKKLVPLLEKQERRAGDMADYWDAMLPLQGYFLSLCSLLERVSLFRFSYYSNSVEIKRAGPSQRIKQLDSDNDALKAVLDANPSSLRIWRADQNKEYSVWADVDLKKLEKPFQTWYAVRSNLSHQGKNAGYRSFDILYASLSGLFDSLTDFLAQIVPDLSHRWRQFGFDWQSNRLVPLVAEMLKRHFGSGS